MTLYDYDMTYCETVVVVAAEDLVVDALVHLRIGTGSLRKRPALCDQKVANTSLDKRYQYVQFRDNFRMIVLLS